MEWDHSDACRAGRIDAGQMQGLYVTGGVAASLPSGLARGVEHAGAKHGASESFVKRKYGGACTYDTMA